MIFVVTATNKNKLLKIFSAPFATDTEKVNIQIKYIMKYANTERGKFDILNE